MAVLGSSNAQASLMEYFPWYFALIECPDGNTYEQPYKEIEDLIELMDSLGDGYSVACVY